MDVKKNAHCLHTDYESGKVTFGTYISTFTDAESDISEAVYTWADEEDASIELRFSISDCVDDMLIGWGYGGQMFDRNARPYIFAESKRPMVDSLRAELIAAIEKLDSIEFKPLP